MRELKKEIRMEVVSETDAMEYCKSNNYNLIKCYMGKQNNAGKLMMLATSEDGTQDNSIKGQEIEMETSVVFTMYGSNRMYVADSKKCDTFSTFNFNQAKLFKHSSAIDKAKAMCKRGNYTWRPLKVK